MHDVEGSCVSGNEPIAQQIASNQNKALLNPNITFFVFSALPSS